MLNVDDIYNEYAKMIYKFLMSLCNNAELAEELTQETYYQAVKSSKKYNGTCKVSTWLCQIAKHLWYQEIEKSKRRKTSTLNEDIVLPDLELPEKICLKFEKMKVIKAVHILDETSKEVVLLRITGAFSFKEIGEVFSKNENWARVTFYRAKQKIVKEERTR
ncbi:RNA polymerase sigma factor [Aminipila sp.]|uniref:RNA polymerase sigma factor n=1 Tax=Aminipila sp. TaxID=2060095 RepID=UPI00289B917F|nr:sigma-70 family RNA polymerase sigma factor [Aminipila sp.]